MRASVIRSRPSRRPRDGTVARDDSSQLKKSASSSPPPSSPDADAVPPPASSDHTVYQRVSTSERMKQLAHATLGYATAAIAASETVSRVAVDVSNFLVNEDEDAPVPTTLRNAARLLDTPELEAMAARVTAGVARGVAAATSSGRAAAAGDAAGGGSDGDADAAPSAMERILDKILDSRNWGLVSVLVASTTRQTLEAIIEVVKQQMRDSNAGGEEDGANRGSGASDVMNDALDKLLRMASSEEGKGVLLDLCSCFVSNAVGIYLDRTQGSNVFDDFFGAAARAAGAEDTRDVIQDIAGRVTGEAVRTMVEVVSPATFDPGASAGMMMTSAQRRDARTRESARRRAGGIERDMPTPVFSGFDVVGGSGGVGGGGGSASTAAAPPRVAAASSLGRTPDAATSTPGPDATMDVATMDESSPSSDGSAAAIVCDDARGRYRERDPAAAGAAAAAFTNAMLKGVFPHAFRLIVAPESRALITDVAGTCVASAVRSFVLSLRDVVFMVGAGKGPRGTGVVVVRAFRVAVLAVVVVYLLTALQAAYLVLTPMVGGLLARGGLAVAAWRE